ncbi:MAG TPA: hypothetical protein VJO72_10085, partial [Candidatus Dormibacteraeota bacterium]|nr:hypothetical protein [Candidatus Dormibacteraeota bacterium]
MSGRKRPFRSAKAKAIQLFLLACLITALSVVLPVKLPARPLSKGMPHTTGKEVLLRPGDLVPRGQAKKLQAFKDGTVKALRKMTLDPTVTCPDMPFTAMALVWDQHGKGALSAQVQVGQDQIGLGRPSSLTAGSDDGPDQGTPEDHPNRRGTSLLWVGSARCSKMTLTLPEGASVGNLHAVFVNSAGTSAADAETTSAVTGSGFGFGAGAAEAATTEPSIITRKQWGADE